MSSLRGPVAALAAVGVTLAVVGAVAAWVSHAGDGPATVLTRVIMATSSITSVAVGAALAGATPRRLLGWGFLVVGCGVQSMLTLTAVRSAGWLGESGLTVHLVAAVVGTLALGLYAAMPVLADPSPGRWWRWQPLASVLAAAGMQWELYQAGDLGGQWIPGESAVATGSSAVVFAACVFAGWGFALWRVVHGRLGERARHVLVLAALLLIVLLPLIGTSELDLLARGLTQWITPLVVGASLATALGSRVGPRLRSGLTQTLTGAVVALGLVTALAATTSDRVPAWIGIVLAVLVGLAAPALARALDAVLERLYEPMTPREQVARLASASQSMAEVGLAGLAPAALRVAMETVGARGGELRTVDGTRLASARPGETGAPQQQHPDQQHPEPHQEQRHRLTVAGSPAGELRLTGVPAQLSPSRTRLLEALLPQLGLAVRATEMGRELRDQRDATLHARDLERDRLRSDLHDSLGPSLSGLILGLEAVEGRLARGDVAAAEQLLPLLRTEAVSAVEEVHRLLLDLGPAGLVDGKLADALRRRVASLDHRVEIDVSIADLPTLQPEAQHAVYRVAGEALTNAIRHGEPSTVRIDCRQVSDEVELVVSDDGHGFVPGAGGTGIGLRSMRERARAVGGRLEIDSGEHGTTVRMRVPAPSGPAAPAPAAPAPAAPSAAAPGAHPASLPPVVPSGMP